MAVCEGCKRGEGGEVQVRHRRGTLCQACYKRLLATGDRVKVAGKMTSRGRPLRLEMPPAEADAEARRLAPLACALARRCWLRCASGMGSRGLMLLDELRGEALFALAEAMARYEPGHGAKLITFACVHIRQHLWDYCKRELRSVSFGPWWHRTGYFQGGEDGPALDPPSGREPPPDRRALDAIEVEESVAKWLDLTDFQMAWRHLAEGRTLEDVGRDFGVNRQRVEQRVSRARQAVLRMARKRQR